MSPLSILVLLIINNVWGYVLFILFLLSLIANWYVYRLVSYNVTHLISTIGRNYERLIIGEYFDERLLGKKKKNSIAFLTPTRRSPKMTFELIKRLYSLLDEKEGELVVVLSKQEDDKDKVSVFDIPYLHEITIRFLGLKWMKWGCRFPLFFEPLASCRIILKHKPHTRIEECMCPYSDISDFCLERNIKLRFYYLQS